MSLSIEEFLKNNFFIQALQRLNIKDQYFYIKNLDLQYILVSSNLLSVTGVKEEDFLYKKDEDFEWGKDQADLFNADDVYTIITKKEHISQHYIHLPEGRVRIKTHKTPILDNNGESIGLLGIAIKT